MNVCDECHIPLYALISRCLRLDLYGFLPFEILELCDLDHSQNGVECLILFRSELVPMYLVHGLRYPGRDMQRLACNALHIYSESSKLVPSFPWLTFSFHFFFPTSLCFLFMDLKDPLRQVQVTSLICSTFAIGSTIYRFYLRRTRLWVDDAFSLFSMLILAIQVAAVLLFPTRSNGVARYYVITTTFYVIVWSSRFSILFSVIRIDPSKLRRPYLYLIGALFLLVCFFLVAQLFYVCTPQTAWREMKVPQCNLSTQVAICKLTFDAVADLLLLGLPIKLFFVLQDKWLRHRLTVIFSTCIITSIVAIVHAIYILNRGGPKIVIVGLVEASTSLIVCNFPIIAATFLRLGDQNSAENSRHENPPGSSQIPTLAFMALPLTQVSATFTVTDTSVLQIPVPSKRPSRAQLLPDDARIG